MKAVIMDIKPVLFLLLVAAALSEAHTKCCFPDQFEIDEGQIVGFVQSGQGTAVTQSAQAAFDYTNRRTGALLQSSGFRYQTITDYNKGVMYTINLTLKTCQKTALPSRTMDHCVPSNATYDGPFYLGEYKLDGDSFSFSVNAEGDVLKGTLSVTQGECVPVGETLFGTFRGRQTLILAGYVNFSPYIKDPSKYFNVPNYCSTGSFSSELDEALAHVTHTFLF
ncbi:development-specific protein LVN1.2-like [Acanthaster planci]|uniref:Development-specific protein LVN1.2-like n=1 Tax=Acanthaster planci TaxID=133434 RepID=A0A8B7ZBN3_ACAPL|nr:development-specific protein LVN1.2-like [Acanthaster planci]